MEELKILMNNKGYSFDHVNRHFRCFAHIMNLGAQDALEMFKVESYLDDKGVNEEDTSQDASRLNFK